MVVPCHAKKREIYDTGLKVPLIIRFPNQQMAGQSVNELISFVDFAPTLLSVTHLPIPDYMQGQAFLGPEQTKPRKYIYAARDRLDNEYDMVRGVRDERYKYFKNFQPEKPYIMNITYRLQMDLMNELIRANEAGELNDEQKLWFADSKPEEELYDLKNDPYELNNLIDDPSMVDKADELRNALQVWMDDIDDKGLISEEEMLSQMWGGKDHPPVTEPPQIELINDQLVITCKTSGASIGYKIVEGDTKSKSWKVYSKPFNINNGEKLLFQAHRIGFEPSQIQEFIK